MDLQYIEAQVRQGVPLPEIAAKIPQLELFDLINLCAEHGWEADDIAEETRKTESMSVAKDNFLKEMKAIQNKAIKNVRKAGMDMAAPINQPTYINREPPLPADVSKLTGAKPLAKPDNALDTITKLNTMVISDDAQTVRDDAREMLQKIKHLCHLDPTNDQGQNIAIAQSNVKMIKDLSHVLKDAAMMTKLGQQNIEETSKDPAHKPPVVIKTVMSQDYQEEEAEYEEDERSQAVLDSLVSDENKPPPGTKT